MWKRIGLGPSLSTRGISWLLLLLLGSLVLLFVLLLHAVVLYHSHHVLDEGGVAARLQGRGRLPAPRLVAAFLVAGFLSIRFRTRL